MSPCQHKEIVTIAEGLRSSVYHLECVECGENIETIMVLLRAKFIEQFNFESCSDLAPWDDDVIHLNKTEMMNMLCEYEKFIKGTAITTEELFIT